jgi:transcriptional regulator with XRE-family HTH domain
VEDIAEILSRNIRERRGELGFTQPELARRAGLSPRAIQQVEYKLRWPTRENLASIASALEIRVGDLLHSGGLPAAIPVIKPTPEEAIKVLEELVYSLSVKPKLSPIRARILDAIGRASDDELEGLAGVLDSYLEPGSAPSKRRVE